VTTNFHRKKTSLSSVLTNVSKCIRLSVHAFIEGAVGLKQEGEWLDFQLEVSHSWSSLWYSCTLPFRSVQKVTNFPFWNWDIFRLMSVAFYCF